MQPTESPSSTEKLRHPAASVIIPHYNDLANLDRCLAMLARQTFREPFEIIVVDNLSSISFDSIATTVGDRAKFLSCGEKGAGPTRNVGIAAAQADRFAFIDSDCRPEPGWLAAGLAALGTWDFVGGQVNVDVEDPDRMTAVEAYEAVFAFRFKDYIEKKGFTGTGNLFAHRAVFDAVGGFKPEVAEDEEWSYRARAAGFSLGYEPLAVVGHPARRTWAEIRRKWARMHDESAKLAAMQKNGSLRFLLRSWLILASIGPKGAEILGSPSLRFARDRSSAFAVMARIQCLRFLWAHKDLLRSRPDLNSK